MYHQEANTISLRRVGFFVGASGAHRPKRIRRAHIDNLIKRMDAKRFFFMRKSRRGKDVAELLACGADIIFKRHSFGGRSNRGTGWRKRVS